jgi:hypothetical protein
MNAILLNVINDSIRNQNLLNIRKNINHNNLIKRNTSLLLWLKFNICLKRIVFNFLSDLIIVLQWFLLFSKINKFCEFFKILFVLIIIKHILSAFHSSIFNDKILLNLKFIENFVNCLVKFNENKNKFTFNWIFSFNSKMKEKSFNKKKVFVQKEWNKNLFTNNVSLRIKEKIREKKRYFEYKTELQFLNIISN